MVLLPTALLDKSHCFSNNGTSDNLLSRCNNSACAKNITLAYVFHPVYSKTNNNGKGKK
jgi:hypothetical protein